EEKKAKKEAARKKLKKAYEDFYKGQAAATIVVDNDMNILMGRHNSGAIAFPGGHVEPGESYEQAALRELKEEAGVTGRLVSELYRGKENGNDVVVYLAEVAEGKVKGSEASSDDKLED